MITSDDKFYRAKITRRIEFAPTCGPSGYTQAEISNSPPDNTQPSGSKAQTGALSAPIRSFSSPHEDELEFFFELVPNGQLTPDLFKLQVGDELLMRKVPKGRFTLETQGERTNHLLVSTVTGVAPFVSYVRRLYKDWKEGSFTGEHKLFLLNGASRSWEFGYLDELQKFAQEAPWLEYVPTVSRPWDDPGWSGEVGRVDDLIRKYTDQWGITGSNSLAYICGHPGMIDAAKGILKRIGFSKELMKEEIYWVPSKDVAKSA